MFHFLVTIHIIHCKCDVKYKSRKAVFILSLVEEYATKYFIDRKGIRKNSYTFIYVVTTSNRKFRQEKNKLSEKIIRCKKYIDRRLKLNSLSNIEVFFIFSFSFVSLTTLFVSLSNNFKCNKSY